VSSPVSRRGVALGHLSSQHCDRVRLRHLAIPSQVILPSSPPGRQTMLGLRIVPRLLSPPLVEDTTMMSIGTMTAHLMNSVSQGLSHTISVWLGHTPSVSSEISHGYFSIMVVTSSNSRISLNGEVSSGRILLKHSMDVLISPSLPLMPLISVV
jgi:hypothetical protein